VKIRPDIRRIPIVAAILLAVGAIGVAWQPDAVDALSRGWMESRGSSVARVLAVASGASLDFDDPVTAHAALGALAGTPDAVYAVLIRESGEPLATWGAVPAALPSATTPAAYDQALLHVRADVVGRAGARGVLRLGFSLQELNERGARTRTLVRWISLLMLALGTAIAFALGLARRVRERSAELARTNAALSELRRMQEQLVVADRRVTLGRLAAGVGHEINNPLSFVMSNLGWVRDELQALRAALAAPGDGRAEAARRFDEIEAATSEAVEGTDRIRQIVRQLKTFSRGLDDEKLGPVRLADAVDAAVAMASHEIKHRARLVRADAPSPAVRASAVRLTQVFVNLLVNAAQAIPNSAPDRNEIRVRIGSDADGFAIASVEDTGCGIAPEHLGRLFEPFFTTKGVGVGTGLGLSISQGIVRQLGGEITVSSTPGAGSTFTVRLPPCPADLVAAATTAEAPPAAQRHASVLVVDDEPLVAAGLARSLSRWHDVRVATGGREAVELVTRGARFEHILCDLMMPGTGGIEVHQELYRIDPGQASRVIFITGGAFTDRAREFLASHPGPCLEKPVDLDQLRRVMDERVT